MFNLLSIKIFMILTLFIIIFKILLYFDVILFDLIRFIFNYSFFIFFLKNSLN